MSVATSFTLRTLRENRVRTAVTIVGIILSVALLTAVLASVTSLFKFMYDQEAAANGTWHATSYPVTFDQMEQARADGRLEQVAFAQAQGFAHAGDSLGDAGSYLTLWTVEPAFWNLCTMPLEEGRLPEAAGEVLLPVWYKDATAFSSEPCQVGTQVTLRLGQRQPYARNGTDAADLPAYLDYGWGYLGDEEGASYGETFVETGDVRSYTVVGFYRYSNVLTLSLSTTPAIAVGEIALPVAEGSAEVSSSDASAASAEVGTDGSIQAYYRVAGAASSEYISEVGRELFGEVQTVHTNLLRFQGIPSDTGIWLTLYGIAGVLAVVIVVASVSLIYNAFAISVTERTRQFGMLSSVGASRRQIRRMVLMEALVLAAVGVPLGLLLGVAGTGVVLHALSPVFSELLGGGASFGLHVEPSYLVLAAALGVVVVLASAWVPSRRAARTTAIEAVRGTQDARRTKAGTSVSAARHPWQPRGVALAQRLFGIEGALARCNATRSKSKGRVAMLSLAVAIMLLVTAGTFSSYWNKTLLAVGGVASYDIGAGTTGLDSFDSQEAHAWYAEMLEVEGVQGRGYAITESGVPALISASMVQGNGIDYQQESFADITRLLDDGSLQTQVTLAFVDDESYRVFLEKNGLEVESFTDKDHPLVVANKYLYGNTGTSYTVDALLARLGTVQLYEYDEQTVDGQVLQRLPEYRGEDGAMCADFVDNQGSVYTVTREEGARAMMDVQVGALVEGLPEVFGSTSMRLVLFMPMSFVELFQEYQPSESSAMTAAFDAEDPEAAGEALFEVLEAATAPSWLVNYAAEQETLRMMGLVVDVFSYSFSVILTLVAVANVFNTLMSSMLLRRREFAMLRSVGMGDAAFNRMILCECLRYGAWGLALGMLAATAVSYAMYEAIGLSVEGLAFQLSWPHVLAAVVLVALTTAVGTAYGLRRARTSSIVDALRTEVM